MNIKSELLTSFRRDIKKITMLCKFKLYRVKKAKKQRKKFKKPFKWSLPGT